MSGMSNFITDFLEGFGPGNLFSTKRRPGAATQVFATEDVPCHQEIQHLADSFSEMEHHPLVCSAEDDAEAQRILEILERPEVQRFREILKNRRASALDAEVQTIREFLESPEAQRIREILEDHGSSSAERQGMRELLESEILESPGWNRRASASDLEINYKSAARTALPERKPSHGT